MSKLAHSNDATMAIIRTQNCPDCNGKGEMYLAGSLVPCAACREDEYRDALMEMGIDPALEIAGSGGLR